MQIFSLFLHGLHMDNGVHHLVVDVTDVSNERIVAYAFVRREYTFEGISEVATWAVTLHFDQWK